MDEPRDEPEKEPEEHQLSEISRMKGEPDPIAPEDATAGYPPSESGSADEGPAGPNAVPDHERDKDGE